MRTENPGNKKPKFDTLKGKGIVRDPNWWKAMTNQEVDALLEGRY